VTRIAAVVTTAIALLALAAGPVLAATPKPKLGRTVVLKATAGEVLVKPRKGKRFKLKKNKSIAIGVGATVDTTKGKVKLTSARKYKGTQSGVFSQGPFVVSQRKSDSLTDLKLVGGDFSGCQTTNPKLGSVNAAAKRKRRRVFGRARGRFRTRGRNSSATVRGTDWLTEDRCEGTVTVNKSKNKTSEIDTRYRDLEFKLEPGQTVTYYCNKLAIVPDMYCVVLLAQPADGLIGGGILTQVDTPTYDFCVQAPDGQAGCQRDIPLTDRDPNGFRQGVFVCPVRQAGKFYFAWSLDHVNLLYPALSISTDVVGPNINCIWNPAAPPGAPKGLAPR
jgi:hypothetical protein